MAVPQMPQVAQFQPSPVRVPSKTASPTTNKSSSKTPKKGLAFDTCLLHSKRADLVCL